MSRSLLDSRPDFVDTGGTNALAAPDGPLSHLAPAAGARPPLHCPNSTEHSHPALFSAPPAESCGHFIPLEKRSSSPTVSPSMAACSGRGLPLFTRHVLVF